MTRAALLALAVLLVAVVTQAGAAGLAGPRLAVVTHDAGYGSELVTIDTAGGTQQRLIFQLASDRPSWSADGSLLALAATGDEWDGSVVAVAGVDGGGLRTYRRAFLNAGDPVIAPDGRSVAFSRVNLVKVLPGRENYLFKSSIWLLDVASGSVRRLTRWRLATSLSPSSFSPDGSMLATGMFSPQGFRAVAVDLSSGDFTLLAREAIEPTYSPDGSRFAFVRSLNWRLNGINEKVPAVDELRVGSVGAVAGTKLLLRRRGFFAWPSWDPSGSRLASTHSAAYELGDRSPHEGDRVMAINADGTCLTRVFTNPEQTLYGSAWQPGIGREAGPIVC